MMFALALIVQQTAQDTVSPGVIATSQRVTPAGVDLNTVARNHSPYFFADESALPTGVRSLANLAVDWLRLPPKM